MNAFAAAMADEVARTRAELTAARSHEDEEGIGAAVDRLRDLSEIVEQVRGGVGRQGA